MILDLITVMLNDVRRKRENSLFYEKRLVIFTNADETTTVDELILLLESMADKCESSIN